MPRPRVDPRWVERICTIAANDPKLGAKAIEKKLRALAEDEGRQDRPSQRTIGRILNEFRRRSEDERFKYRHLSWPGAMLQGQLPWEASHAILDLLRFYRVEFPRYRPTIHLGEWFWRVTLAAQDLDVGRRFGIALDLATLEAGAPIYGEVAGLVETEAEHLDRVETFLACAPWRSSENDEVYRATVGGGEDWPLYYEPLDIVGAFAEQAGQD